ncbi:DNA replication factor C, large subunit [Piedraia hortae CBS 480.64]|uniref:Replication factor C subunit 1 n=1 Tax=Piedraia hortae CBS 480.64 TaxID=1314780 RepID=A0A6A7C4N3_9PEZI|nr:DNA replication factor C, large subunit [Piedraia hortae CBS 480.64]
MPADIRAFFGGKPEPKEEKKKLRGRAKRVIDDDEDDEMEDVAAEPEVKPVAEETTADDYFAKGKKPRRTAAKESHTEPVPTRTRPKKANPEEEVKTTPRAGRKRKTVEDDPDDLIVEDVRPAQKATPAKKKATPKSTLAKKQKKEPAEDSSEIKAIFDSIPTIRPPSPPPENGEKPKFQFGASHANSAAPAGAIDSSQLPQGEENCLAGLTFVFTGQLQSLGREQGQNLVKQYGGKVVGAPSKKTSYIVLGEDAGPKKLKVIKDNNLKVINEEGLFELIKRLPANGGDSAAAAKMAEKKAAEDAKIKAEAAEMDRQEKERRAAAAKAASPASSATDKGKARASDVDSRLWTERYAPQQLSQICGNKAQVEKLSRWLEAFPKNQRTKFKMPGKDGSGTFRAVMIHGPPGIGKTTAAHLVAKLNGYDVVESNASDTRSKKLVETGLKGVLSTTSLMGYFGRGSEDVEASKKKLVLIMDEVDGMSAGDRGGVGALAAVCRKTMVPIILICNDRKLPKMKPFDFVTFDLPFRRPTTDMIRSRISTIAFREGLKLPVNVITALIEGSGSDIRQVVNMLSTVKLAAATMTFEEGKEMSKAWEKHIILRPWDMVGKILGGGLFNPASQSTLNDKQELYFNDHEFAPLMLQENYLNASPQRANRFDGKRKKLAVLDLVSRAADSISDGDLVDRMIHGSQQQWSLMPVHAMFSFVRPASFVYGSLAGSGQTRFTQWLGKNSSQGKLMRMVRELQGHMRLRVSADRHEVRQTYVPVLYELLVRRLKLRGKDAVPEIIQLMDGYYLTKEDFDAIWELGVGELDWEAQANKIDGSAKGAFTRA